MYSPNGTRWFFSYTVPGEPSGPHARATLRKYVCFPETTPATRVAWCMAASDESGTTQVWEGLPLDHRHKIGSAPDSAFDYFAPHPANLNQAQVRRATLRAFIDAGYGLDSAELVYPKKRN